MIKRALLLVVAPALLALLSGVLAAQAQAPEVGMTLGATAPAECNAQGCRVASGAAFSITVRADPAPDVDLAGISTEVFFGGLVWQIRTCLTELQIGRADGEDIASCVQQPGPGGQARHVIISEVGAASLAPLEDLSSGDVIFELAVRCPAAGTFNVFLTAETASRGSPNTDAPFGALYYGADTAPIPVKTQGNQRLDLDGNGDLDDVNYAFADSLRVTCQGGGGFGSQSPVPIETTDGNGGNTATPGGPTPTEGATGAAPTITGTISPEDATATAAAIVNGDGDGDDDDGGGSVWLWVIVGVVGVGAAGGLGYLAWRRYQGTAGTPPDASPPAT